MSASPAYALRAECRGHEDDVRGVAVMAPDAFATCSRDKTVRVWREAIGDDGYATAAVCVGHASFVTALAFVPANAIPSLPSGGVVSGGRDTSICVWGEPMSGEPVARLEGHSLDVTAVCVLNDGTIVSGAMDKSIKVWSGTNLGTCVKTLADAHGSSVLALVALPDTNGFISGSADKTIKVWNDVETLVSESGEESGAKPSQTLIGHSDTVRGLAIMPGVGFLSASHDCTARLWSRGGETAAIFAGHAALVYSVASIRVGSGSFVVTGSEDNTCKLWNPADGSCVQTLAHPGCVWAVSGGLGDSGNNEGCADVVTCCADGVARVWTRDAVRQDAAAQKRLDDALLAAAEQKAQTALAEQQKKIKTEPPEFLEQPGAADGATAVIREAAGSVAAYAWNAGTRSWERLGEVTGVQGGAHASGTKKHVNGVAYDFVFDVDIAEGAPTLKLPFNVGENPYDAAERFLETNGLDPGYREQVVNFITQNVGEDAFKNATRSDLSADPFTGAGAYVPGTGGTDTTVGGGRTDPFTGAGAYVPSGTSAALAGAAERKRKLFQFVPAKPHQCVVFPTAAFDKMLAKIQSLGASEEELRAFAACASADETSALDPSATAVLTKALADWPVESLFPLLDLCKALCARFDTDAGGAALGAPAAAAMAAACARAASAARVGPNADANALTAARLFANAFQRRSPRSAFSSTAPMVLDGLARNVARNADAKPAARLALATALLNVSAHCSDFSEAPEKDAFVSEEIAAQAASVGAELLMHAMPIDGADADSFAAAEVLFFRGLVALGTFAAKSPGTKASLRDLGVAELAEAVRSHEAFKGGNAVRAAEDVKKALE